MNQKFPLCAAAEKQCALLSSSPKTWRQCTITWSRPNQVSLLSLCNILVVQGRHVYVVKRASFFKSLSKNTTFMRSSAAQQHHHLLLVEMSALKTLLRGQQFSLEVSSDAAPWRPGDLGRRRRRWSTHVVLRKSFIPQVLVLNENDFTATALPSESLYNRDFLA